MESLKKLNLKKKNLASLEKSPEFKACNPAEITEIDLSNNLIS
jgi:hypothetical protein